MNLDDAQRKKVTEWIVEGLKLAEIQNRIATELTIQMTYMEVRLLVDDLKLTPKDVEIPKPVAPTTYPSSQSKGAKAQTVEAITSSQPLGTAGGLSVSVDQIARPGTVVSGKVTFTDGNKADWSLDQSGRLGLVPQRAGYRPPPADIQQFQMTLESELGKMGF